MKHWLILLSCLFGVCFGAKEVTLTLKSLQMNQTSEASGDELYMSVTSYPSDSPSDHVLIPRHPQTWLSKYLNQLKDVELWRGVVAEKQKVSLMVSLIEQDLVGYGLDDLIGSIKLHVNYVDGLKVKWGVPNKPEVKLEVKKVGSSEQVVVKLDGDESHYDATFLLTVKDAKDSKKEKTPES